MEYDGTEFNPEQHVKVRRYKMNWDQYFHNICEAVASKSPCLSRKIGAILVRENSIISTGYNGPPRGVPHCGQDRIMKDKSLPALKEVPVTMYDTTCPRKLLGYESGTHLELCPAQHAEINAISNAARIGAHTIGTTLYMNCIIPCKNCFGAIINAGIESIVIDDDTPYDDHTKYIIDHSDIDIRRFRDVR